MEKIVLQITSNCNLDCKFCSDLFKHEKERNITEILAVIDKMPLDGVKKIEITGGEPLLYPNLLELLKEIKARGFEIGICTNGINLNQKTEILSLIDEITLPVDSVVPEKLEEMGRDKNQLVKTVKNIGLIKDVNPDIKIKIATVLNKKTVDEVKSLLGIIELLYLDEWEVHQFLPHGTGRDNIRDFLLGDIEFEQAISYLETTPISSKLTPVSIHNKLKEGWLITPSLNLVKLEDYRSVLYGSALKLDNSTFNNLFRPKVYLKQKH